MTGYVNLKDQKRSEKYTRHDRIYDFSTLSVS